MSPSSPPNAKVVVLWVIWFSLVCSIVIYQFLLGGGWRGGDDARSPLPSPALWISAGSLLGAAIVRWLFVPKARDIQRLLVLMIIGVALSESVVFYSIFLFPADMPATKMGLFVLSFLSALQFAPVYAKKIASQENTVK